MRSPLHICPSWKPVAQKEKKRKKFLNFYVPVVFFFSARSETISSGNQLVGKLNRFWGQWPVFSGLPFWLFTHAESLLKHHGSILLGAQSDCKSKPESFQYQNSCPSNTDISIYRATNSKPDTEYKNFSRNKLWRHNLYENYILFKNTNIVCAVYQQSAHWWTCSV